MYTLFEYQFVRHLCTIVESGVVRKLGAIKTFHLTRGGAVRHLCGFVESGAVRKLIGIVESGVVRKLGAIKTFQLAI